MRAGVHVHVMAIVSDANSMPMMVLALLHQSPILVEVLYISDTVRKIYNSCGSYVFSTHFQYMIGDWVGNGCLFTTNMTWVFWQALILEHTSYDQH